MRWAALFADLEAQAAGLSARELSEEASERGRIELGEIEFAHRMRGASGQPLRLTCAGGLTLAGHLTRVGAGWVLLDEGGGREAMVHLDAVAAVTGLPRHADTLSTSVESRLGWRHALRVVTRDRSAVRMHLRDATTLLGTPDRVGADFVDLAMHPADEPRRGPAVREFAVVALRQLVAVRRSVG
jgi:hypothetical protein